MGLVTILVALLAPIGAAVSARKSPLVPATFGLYVAWAAHTAVEFDWALVGRDGLRAAGRRRDGRLRPNGILSVGSVRYGVAAGLTALLAASFVFLVSDTKLAHARDALARERPDEAVDSARDAARWAPWSSEPWLFIGAVEGIYGQKARSRAAYLRALEHDRSSWLVWDAVRSVLDRRREGTTPIGRFVGSTLACKESAPLKVRRLESTFTDANAEGSMMFRRKQRGSKDMEGLLRAERPQPSPDLVDDLVRRIEAAEPVAVLAPRPRRQLALAGLVTGTLVAAGVAFGVLSDGRDAAANSAASAAKAVRTAVAPAATSSTDQTAVTTRAAQYVRPKPRPAQRGSRMQRR